MSEFIGYTPDLRRPASLARDIAAMMGAPVHAALIAAHEDMAGRVRDYAAEELTRRKTKRPQTRGNLMEAAIRDRENSIVTEDGFTVGVEEWLDRSPAALYWRRIETGGPNPMSELGDIVASFFGGARDGLHSRMHWRQVRLGGFTVKARDAAYAGYHTHEAAGDRFEVGRLPLAAYKKHFAAIGLSFKESYRETTGLKPTNRSVLGG